jgi:hypothetical protein
VDGDGVVALSIPQLIRSAREIERLAGGSHFDRPFATTNQNDEPRSLKQLRKRM